MNSMKDTYELRNGVRIPCIGFGTWQMPNDQSGVDMVKEALAVGYRHIDTASGYDNEASVGKGVVESGLPREQIFITSKLTNNDRGYDVTRAAFQKTLELLGTSYLDLYLIHWPNPLKYREDYKKWNAESWRAMEDLYEEGKIKAIGVSNFRPHHFEALMESAKVMPLVNQIRLCPGDEHQATLDYCKEQGILLEAYSPLGSGQIFADKTLLKLASKYGKSVAQIAIRWSLQKAYLPLPKTMTYARLHENLDVFDFKLSQEDMDLITAMEGKFGLSKDPDLTSF